MGAQITMPLKKLGAWLNRAKDTTYQAATDGYVIAYSSIDTVIITLKTDGSNPPTTVRQKDGGTDEQGVNSLVRKDDYWRVEATNIAAMFWIPWEP